MQILHKVAVQNLYFKITRILLVTSMLNLVIKFQKFNSEKYQHAIHSRNNSFVLILTNL